MSKQKIKQVLRRFYQKATPGMQMWIRTFRKAFGSRRHQLSRFPLDENNARRVAHLTAPSAKYDRDGWPPVTHLMEIVWNFRPELQNLFPLDTAQSCLRYGRWFCTVCKWESGIDERLFPDPRHFFTHPRSVAAYRIIDRLIGLRRTGRLGSKIRRQNRPEASNAETPLPGLNIIGFAKAETGMGQHLRGTARALDKYIGNLCVYDDDVGLNAGKGDRSIHQLVGRDVPFSISVFILPLDRIIDFYLYHGPDAFASRYNIGYLVWELSEIPEAWVPALSLFDEIWTPTRFTEKAFASRVDCPVTLVPECIWVDQKREFVRGYFGLPDDRYLFLFSFDFHSMSNRKNPWACIRAFFRAFPRGDEKVGLVIKCQNADEKHPDWLTMIQSVGSDPRVTVINRTYSRDETLGLVQVCDCFVSLHRGEGFGLGPAEAMYFGKPVIVTNYSGNVDFTLPDNSCPVDYRLIPVLPGDFLFYEEGQVWADANVDHAAGYMKRLVDDPEWSRQLGEKARKHIQDHLSPEAIAGICLKRLAELDPAVCHS